MTTLRLATISILSTALTISLASAQTLEVQNNQPFPIRMPWPIRGLKAPAGKQVQQLGEDAVIMIDAPASGVAHPLDMPAYDSIVTTIIPRDNGIAIYLGKSELGTLTWSIIFQTLDKTPTEEEAAQTAQHFAEAPRPLPLAFKAGVKGPLFETSSAEATQDGLKLVVNLDVYKSGFIDIQQTLTNESAPLKKVYCAVVCAWKQKEAGNRSVGYDNHIVPLASESATPFRKGEGRHLFIQRGVDWINTSFGETSVAILNDFTPSFTVHHDKTAKMPPRWVGANTPQLAQEAMLKGDTLYSITEVARPSIKYYGSRFDSNVLPTKDQPVTSTARLIVSQKKLTDEEVDQAFVGYTSYNDQKKDGDAIKLTLGVPYTKFGTAYFPYSTLGENFEALHMPGQSKDTYWPLSADTVTNYKLFADDIKRDLRIAKSMGFESIRMHHLEVITTLPKSVQDEYLDFFFGELKHLGLTALLDVKLPPESIAELVKKYRPQVDGVEVDNEVLIFGMNDEDVQWWKDVYKAVKEVAPDLPVHWTAATNTGAFDRMTRLGVPFDRMGEHAYTDSLAAVESTRGYALAFSAYGSKIGKPPVITEWNWRFLTRMTPEDRAKVYPPIFENVVKTRCMPEIYQFQLQESLAMASHTLRGIRHYELLNLSRRPRPEAMEFVDLIQKYGNPASPQHVLHTKYQSVTMQDVMKGKPTILVSVTNESDKPLSVTATAEGSSDLKLAIQGGGKFEIAPHQTATARLAVEFPENPQPGFYYAFVRFDGGDDLVSYATVELRNPGGVTIDKDKGVHAEVAYAPDALDFDFNRDTAIVYASGRDAESRWDVENAWLIYQTLESATGRPVKIFQLKDLPDDLRKSGNLVIVGMPESHDLIKSAAGEVKSSGKSWVARAKATDSHGDWLIVAGDDEASLNLSAIDLTLRYWKHAKDSGMRRIPLTDKPTEKGPDPSVLP